MLHSKLHTPRSPFLRRDRCAILAWLTLCAALVASMVVIGGYTRLSGSGLSITQWKPVHGVVPPLNLSQWQEEFEAYQASPQYQKVNQGMTLAEFKVIFWPEFIHRLLGRLIGAVFFLPLIVFALRRSFSARFGWRLLAIFALGGLQGLIGWLMVKSGLVGDPHVSPIRLALHLSTALLILALLIWAAMDVIACHSRAGGNLHYPPASKMQQEIPACAGMTFYYIVWFIALCLQIILGAFMAGLHAGLAYNTWPNMNGHALPESWGNIEFVQFLHRNLAVLVAFGFVFWWYCHRKYVKNARLGKVCALILVLIGVQFTLGVLTLIKAVPLPLAMMHQDVAVGLFCAAVIILWHVKHERRI